MDRNVEKHDVKSWKGDYTFENPDSYQDGYGWDLWLQYEDGSVEKFKGSGTDIDKLTPEQFDDFVKDVYRFAEEKIGDVEPKQCSE